MCIFPWDSLNSLPLFSYSCANTPSLRLSSVMLANLPEPVAMFFEPLSLSLCACLFHTLLLMQQCMECSFQTATHPNHMTPTLQHTTLPPWSSFVTHYVPIATSHPLSFHLFFSPSQLVWVNGFPPTVQDSCFNQKVCWNDWNRPTSCIPDPRPLLGLQGATYKQFYCSISLSFFFLILYLHLSQQEEEQVKLSEFSPVMPFKTFHPSFTFIFNFLVVKYAAPLYYFSFEFHCLSSQNDKANSWNC